MKLSAVFGSPRLGEWVEGYLQWLKQRDCKNSTLSNYTSGIINTHTYIVSVSVSLL